MVAPGSTQLPAEEVLDQAAERPGQSHRRFLHHENDALDRSVGDRPVIDGAVRDRDVADPMVTALVVESALQHKHRLEPAMGVGRNGPAGPAAQKTRLRARVAEDPALLETGPVRRRQRLDRLLRVLSSCVAWMVSAVPTSKCRQCPS
jgi:hypothetical protein